MIVVDVYGIVVNDAIRYLIKGGTLEQHRKETIAKYE
jgi:hypothetical protein